MSEALRSSRPGDPVLFIKIDLKDAGDPLRVWSGVNDWKGGPDDDDGVYLGRRLLNFPALVQLANGKAHRTEIALSGASAAIKALVGDRAAAVRGAEVLISFAVMKGAAPHPDVAWPLWQTLYIADQPGIRFEGGAAVVVISAATAFARRKRPASAYWTHQDQITRHPGDMVCSRIADLNEGTPRVFKPSAG